MSQAVFVRTTGLVQRPEGISVSYTTLAENPVQLRFRRGWSVKTKSINYLYAKPSEAKQESRKNY